MFFFAVGGAGANIRSSFGMGSIVGKAEVSNKSFDDVVGIDEAKTDLQEIVMYLRDPKRFTRLGGTLPKGVSVCCVAVRLFALFYVCFFFRLSMFK